MSNLTFLNIYHFSLLLTSVVSLLIFFYYFFKAQILKLAPSFALKTRLINFHPLSQVVGAIELATIAVFHVFFCLILAVMFGINISNVFLNTTLIDCFYGALIGVGCIGISILLCTIGMKIIETTAKAPKSLHEWLAISSAGWIRHHKHTLKIFPIAISILIITLQIGSEETIFRSILIQTFEPYGILTAFSISTLLFILMQLFHMPNMISAMFPIIGATVMGIIHGLLYLYHPSITPLIISHLTFFIFAVI